ncbi:FRIGIDA-like protein 1 isoform X2 [Prunus dulcis]|uniref:FRIGIDA-like protein 1 isoform X2 n=1 Tax=Prunus dulcis TaxID=3755 RepID=UPI001482DF6D|nr:FRIGIDA-like protein 1 isoform X2 [Prunus dulcis]
MATTVETMSAAIELIETKKENLKKAFDELQAHYNVLSSFNLTWSDLDSHFTSIKDSLNQKLQLLQTLESQSSNPSSSIPQDPCSSNPPSQKPQDPSSSSCQIPKDPSSSSNLPTHIAGDPSLSSLTLAQITEDTKTLTRIKKDPPSSSISSTEVVKEPSLSNPPTRNTVELGTSLQSVSVPPRPELVAFCERMDAMGLRKYMNETLDNRNTIRAELLGAIRYAKDPAAMVLDAVDDFYSENGRDKGDKDPELFAVRRSGVLLLEVLMGVSPDVGFEVRERAKKLALAWKGKVSMDGENPFEALGFLHLVAAYGLQSEFKMDELVDHFVIIARYRQAIELCQKIGLGDKIAVPLLKSYLKESKKLAKKVCKDGNNSRKSMNEATAKETGALKSVIKVIEDLKLESEYPPAVLQKRLEQLEKEKANRKRHAEAPAVKPQQHKQQTAKQQKLKQQQYENKHPRMTAPVGPATVSNSINAAGLLPAYALSGTAPPIPPYAGSSAGLYGFAGGQMGFLGNPGPASNHLYSSDHYVPSGYYNRQTAYGGYGVPPEYHPPSHYPQ